MLRTAPASLTVQSPAVEPFVLVVDDHEPSLLKLQKVIESSGYECVAVPSALEALLVCDARRPNLVVTDLSMPGVDGQGLARELKARDPSIPIVLVTGESLDATTHAAFRNMFVRVFIKPLQVEPFLSVLGDLLPRLARVTRA